MAVRPIPEGYHSVTPYMIVRGADRALEYYARAFGAIELMRMQDPGGVIRHAEIRIGDSPIMMSDEAPDMGMVAPTDGGTPMFLMIYVDDVDTVFSRAISEGGTELRAVEDQFYGDRTGTLRDPFGHVWTVGTHVEDVSPEEMTRRMEKMAGG